MNWSDNLNTRIYRRCFYLAVAGSIGALSIICGLAYLQLFSCRQYIHQGIRNFTRYETMASPRGNIIDCNGRHIATNRPILTLLWHGTEQRNWTYQQRRMLLLLEQMYNVSLVNDPQLLSCERMGRSYPIAYDASIETISIISEQFPSMPNISIETQFRRHYPFYKQAAHIIGHINGMQHGQMGLEKLCNDRLIGHPGYRQKHITATGKTFAHYDIIPAAQGGTVRTTIDMDIQACAENAFLQQNHNGAIVCIDANNGDIKALVSRPSFDPNAFTSRIDTNTWNTWQQDFALLNRACNALYPPASLFKLITTAAALEEQMITPQSTWYCSGTTTFAGRTYACNRRKGHEAITITDAIAHSCNIPFYEIGKDMDINTLTEYAEKLGLNHPTGIALPEHAGLIPSHEWKEEQLGERWWPGETLAATIGQSYLLVTPLQVACMITAICQGHHIRPRILTDEPIQIRHLDISHETQTLLQNALRTVVTDGRARDVGRIEKHRDALTLYAKTGTAQTSHKVRRAEGTQFLEHGWFAVHATYKNHPPITLVVLLEHIGSSRIAAHTAHNFLNAYCDVCDKIGPTNVDPSPY